MDIMIIDDSKIDLFVSQKIIEKVNSDCNIEIFASGSSAINFLKKSGGKTCQKIFVPDVIFLDINMPEMDGFQFLKEFSKLSNVDKKDIKIHVLSSSTNSQDIKKTQENKYCAGFINKPLTATSLNKVIVRYRPYLKMFDYQADDVNLKRKVKLVE